MCNKKSMGQYLTSKWLVQDANLGENMHRHLKEDRFKTE